MNPNEFSTTVPAKWVLTGEHSVLRGKSAIAFPYSEFNLKISYTPSNERLQIIAPAHEAQVLSLLERACAWLKIPFSTLDEGVLEIQSQIPVGAGLGSSAALCVALARFTLWKSGNQKSVETNPCIALATHLEHVFHGKSSGMDIHLIATGKPILFTMNEEAKPIQSQLPSVRFELRDTRQRGKTLDCIQRVKKWQDQSPDLIHEYDQKMHDATEAARNALETFGHAPDAAESSLILAMNQAQACFEAWGLVNDTLLAQKAEILREGALAVKLTGSGLGGFWVVLKSS